MKDLIWQKFWRLIVMHEWKWLYDKWWHHRRTVFCRCICWVEKEYRLMCLTCWDTKSCWCLSVDNARELWKRTWWKNCMRTKWKIGPNKWLFWDKSYKWKWWDVLKLIGKKYFNLTICSYSWKDKVTCICKCWNIKDIKLANLNRWIVKSCWCMQYKNCHKKWKESNNYRHDLSDKEREMSKNRWYDGLRINRSIDIKKRDWYICKKCNQCGWNLESHHIYNRADNIEKRYELENWITLCKNCHKIFHKKFWKKYNNNEQLNLFFNNIDDNKW